MHGTLLILTDKKRISTQNETKLVRIICVCGGGVCFYFIYFFIFLAMIDIQESIGYIFYHDKLLFY